MPYNSVDDLPPAFKGFTPEQRRWVLPVLNALLRVYDDEGQAIAIAIALLKKHFGLGNDNGRGSKRTKS